jgi:DNA-binding response OmpR family regulator
MSRILIVEDDAILAEAVAALLDHSGHRVVGIADDMMSALSIARVADPELVLMDIKLANGSDGIETARRLQTESSARVVFMTGNRDRQTRERAATVGPVGFLIKPFSPQQLIDIVDDQRWSIPSSTI